MIEHGKIGRYTYYRCRCEECRRASRDQKRKERARPGHRAHEIALADIRKAWR